MFFDCTPSDLAACGSDLLNTAVSEDKYNTFHSNWQEWGLSMETPADRLQCLECIEGFRNPGKIGQALSLCPI
jgi:hypothetical protein